MTRVSSEFKKFNSAMDQILKANPASVKAAMEAEKMERAKRRKSKTSSAVRALSGKD